MFSLYKRKPELIRIFSFVNTLNIPHKGGFIDATVLGDSNSESDVVFAKQIILACCNGSIINFHIHDELKDYKLEEGLIKVVFKCKKI